MFGRRKPIESASRSESSVSGDWKAGKAADGKGPTLVSDNAAAGSQSTPDQTTPETTKGWTLISHHPRYRGLSPKV